MISSDVLFLFFLEITGFLGRKLYYLGKISGNDLLFLEITLNLGRKLILNIPILITWFWHANCITSLRGHRTPLGITLVYTAYKTGNSRFLTFKNRIIHNIGCEKATAIFVCRLKIYLINLSVINLSKYERDPVHC